jgi:hypothetical protein
VPRQKIEDYTPAHSMHVIAGLLVGMGSRVALWNIGQENDISTSDDCLTVDTRQIFTPFGSLNYDKEFEELLRQMLR